MVNKTLYPDAPATPSNSTKPIREVAIAKSSVLPLTTARPVAPTSAATKVAGAMKRSVALVAVPTDVITLNLPPDATGARNVSELAEDAVTLADLVFTVT